MRICPKWWWQEFQPGVTKEAQEEYEGECMEESSDSDVEEEDD